MEVGFRVAKAQGEVLFKGQLAQVRSIMAAALGLLAFMLAFSFNIAQSHFEKRNEAFLMEINAISSAYMSAGLLVVGEEESSKSLLRDFVAERVATVEALRANRMDDVASAIQNADGSWKIYGAPPRKRIPKSSRARQRCLPSRSSRWLGQTSSGRMQRCTTGSHPSFG